MNFITVVEQMERQRQFNRETGTFTMVAPSGTQDLPLDEKLRIFIEVFESGCSCTHIGNLPPEDCPECVRAFVNAIRKTVGL
jgi:hypothetical protein